MIQNHGFLIICLKCNKKRLTGESVYDKNAENMYEVYKDLWKTNSQRLDMIEYGIASKNIRKLI